MWFLERNANNEVKKRKKRKDNIIWTYLFIVKERGSGNKLKACLLPSPQDGGSSSTVATIWKNRENVHVLICDYDWGGRKEERLKSKKVNSSTNSSGIY